MLCIYQMLQKTYQAIGSENNFCTLKSEKNNEVTAVHSDNKPYMKRNNLWLTILFLYSVNFFNQQISLMFFLTLVTLILLVRKKITLSIFWEVLLILLFSVSYFLILTIYKNLGFGWMIIYVVGPTLNFLIGYFLVWSKEDIYMAIIVIVAGKFTNGFLNMLQFFKVHGMTLYVPFRLFPDIWSGTMLTATLQNTYFVLMVSLLFYCILLFANGKKFFPSVLLLSITLSVLLSLVMGNRALFVVMFLTFISDFLFYVFFIKKSRKMLRRLLLIIIVILFLGYTFYINNVLNFKVIFENSTLYFRFKNPDDSSLSSRMRLNAYKKVAEQFFDFPLGGYKMDIGNVKYVHNMFLDILYATGLIPFFFITLYTIKSLANLLNVVKQKSTVPEFKILVLSVYTGLLLTFMFEPILEGSSHLFLIFCLINGMVKKQVDMYKIQKDRIVTEKAGHFY